MPSSDSPLAGRVALVSGGSRGIGRAISLALASEGCHVGINYRRDEAAAAATSEAVQASGVRSVTYKASVDEEANVGAMVDFVADALGPPTILIHSGGIASRGNTVADTESAEMERVLKTHVMGGFHLAKACIPHMRASGGGDIIMIASISSKVRQPRSAPYCIAKTGLDVLTTILAKELQADRIHVNAIAPGLVATDMGDRLAKAMTGGRVSEAAALDAEAPFGRVCRPEDVANVVRFLLSPLADYVSGAWIQLDGGTT